MNEKRQQEVRGEDRRQEYRHTERMREDIR